MGAPERGNAGRPLGIGGRRRVLDRISNSVEDQRAPRDSPLSDLPGDEIVGGCPGHEVPVDTRRSVGGSGFDPEGQWVGAGPKIMRNCDEGDRRGREARGVGGTIGDFVDPAAS